MDDRFLSDKEVRIKAGNKSRATIWRWERDGLFPKRRQIGPNSVGWLESEINNWLASKPYAAQTA